MGGSAGKSESQSQNQFGQDVWGPQSGALGNMYGQQSNLFDQTNQANQALAPGAVGQQQGIFDAANPAWQQQLGGGAYQGMNLQGDYNQALQGGGNEQFVNENIMGGAGNDYADAMRGQMQQDSSERLGQNLAMNDARAAGGGLPGSSRHGMTESRLYDDSEKNLGRLQTGVGYDTFDKDLDRKLGIAQRADQFDMGRLQQTGQMLGNQNQAMQGGLNFGQGMQQLGMGQFAPGQVSQGAASNYANNIGGPTILGSGGGDSSSKGTALSGGVGAK